MTKTVKLADIIITDRIRKDFGDIDELARDIEENGLMNPPVVTEDMKLIAGERRCRALKKLGRTETEVRVMPVADALQAFKMEISENENRKDFTFSERMRYAKLLKEEYSAQARENSRANLKEGDKSPSGQLCPVGETTKKVADEVGFGQTNLKKAEYIYDHADDEMIAALDENKLSINKAYTTLKAKAAKLEAEMKKQSDDFDQERADAARRLEKQTRRAEQLETDLNVVKRLGDPELVKEIDTWKARTQDASSKAAALEKELATEKNRNKMLEQASGYAEAIEEERDRLRDKVEELREELLNAQNGLSTLQDVVALVTKVRPQIEQASKYVSVEIADAKIKEIAKKEISALAGALTEFNSMIGAA